MGSSRHHCSNLFDHLLDHGLSQRARPFLAHLGSIHSFNVVQRREEHRRKPFEKLTQHRDRGRKPLIVEKGLIAIGLNGDRGLNDVEVQGFENLLELRQGHSNPLCRITMQQQTQACFTDARFKRERSLTYALLDHPLKNQLDKVAPPAVGRIILGRFFLGLGKGWQVLTPFVSSDHQRDHRDRGLATLCIIVHVQHSYWRFPQRDHVVSAGIGIGGSFSLTLLHLVEAEPLHDVRRFLLGDVVKKNNGNCIAEG